MAPLPTSASTLPKTEILLTVGFILLIAGLVFLVFLGTKRTLEQTDNPERGPLSNGERQKKFRENKQVKWEGQRATVEDLEEKLKQSEEALKECEEQLLQPQAPKQAPAEADFERERSHLNLELSRLASSLEKDKQLLGALSKKSTLISTLDTLLESKGTGEKGFQFVIEATNMVKQSCPGVSNELLVGFAQNYFFPGVIVNEGKAMGLAERQPVVLYRSVHCEGSPKGYQCTHCQDLLHFISRKKYAYFEEGNLGSHTEIQRRR